MRLFIIHGPNLNMLGKREPSIYGSRTYQELLSYIDDYAESKNIKTSFFQSNHEGALVDFIQAAYEGADGIILNPGAYGHTSIAILDALRTVDLPAVEVHLSDIYRREAFRHVSYTALGCIKTICGKGFAGYMEAIDILANHLQQRERKE